MKILFPWLKEFVGVTATQAEMGARLSLAGLPLEGIEETQAGPVLDFEVTNNRADCLSHYGVAREAAAIYRLPLRPLQLTLREDKEKTSRAIRVRIECPDLCPRYTARVLRGVTVQPSPLWLRERLAALGQSSINNVVDIANYVMFELGQPMHAFDLARIQESSLIVRRSQPNEKLRTLDGIERVLPKDACVIAGPTGAVAIGGVMGGANSEISFDSRDILLEAAAFDPLSIRKTAKALGLRTEASFRFERGADIQMVELASRRAAQMILELAGGKALAGVVDAFPAPPKPVEIELTRREWLRVMGADAADEEVEAILGALGFQPKRTRSRSSTGAADAAWRCRQPSWRGDVSREIDLIEEVARLHGYDKFPPRLPPTRLPVQRLPLAAAEERLCERLIALGYQEILSIPLVNPEQDDLFQPANAVSAPLPAIVNNPLAQDASRMRSSGILNMLQALEWNINHSQRDLRLFEIGKRYELRDGVARETRILTLGATGQARAKNLYDACPARDFTFADLRGDLDSVGELAGGWLWQASGPSWLAAGRCARLSLSRAPDENLGCAGQLSRRLAEQLKLRHEVFLGETDLTPLLEAIENNLTARRFASWPRFPAVERDFSLNLSDATPYGALADAVRSLGIAEITRIEPVDLFRGAGVGDGRYSLLLRITFQSERATLTDAQLSEFSTRIIAALEQAGATLRAR
jgi:phenylalanyl-tRNA synthetase beta chain